MFSHRLEILPLGIDDDAVAAIGKQIGDHHPHALAAARWTKRRQMHMSGCSQQPAFKPSPAEEHRQECPAGDIGADRGCEQAANRCKRRWPVGHEAAENDSVIGKQPGSSHFPRGRGPGRAISIRYSAAMYPSPRQRHEQKQPQPRKPHPGNHGRVAQQADGENEGQPAGQGRHSCNQSHALC